MSANAVEDITPALEKLTVTDANADVDADAARAASADEGRRLYIGNLNYATTEEQLKEFFKGYDVESSSIPTNPRTGRAVGYAFVDLKSKEDAQKAMGELSGKEVLGRKVSVQLARKPGASANNTKENEAPTQQGSGNKQGGRRGFRYRGGRRGRGGFRNRVGRGQRNNNNNQQVQAAAVENDAPTNVPGQVLPLTEVKTENKAEETKPAQEKKPAPEKFRPKKKRGPPEDGVPSKTKVMVANLPYELTEDKLKELFKDYQPESAKIALRPIPRFMVRKLQARGEPRKGRGFGFVTLASEEMQQKAVKEMNGITVEGREIAVKVAIDNPKLEEEAAAKAAAVAAAVEKKEEDEKDKPAAEEAKPITNGVNGEPAAAEAK